MFRWTMLLLSLLTPCKSQGREALPPKQRGVLGPIYAAHNTHRPFRCCRMDSISNTTLRFN